VATRAGNFERALHRELATDLPEIHAVVIRSHQNLRRVDFQWLGRIRRPQGGHEVNGAAKIGDWINIDSGNYCRFFSILIGENHMLDESFARQNGYWQRALDRTHTTIQGQFADTEDVNQTVFLCKISVSSQDTERDREVKARALFAHIGWGQIDCDSLKRKEKPAIGDRGTNAFARFAYGSIGQTNDGDG
jgi:hypothetical protein